ncbi:porin family protein [Megasphaera vaginalis (ex Srinivasan et al. 2021)]|uniref:Outer membrane protein beta-barrel domain protein n=1 Tax=Megasphaera vaginalis (ex Srinivasan et al. 2021) TaxID=1111454 RepID=U7UQW5_9FIRM|nr:porin family protein [Megasphaera vaginalis (ex Srinivasan et al. 2021)]ERT61676.1 outer membrane protein beta-barrel domain protein [Megasphaera vaginalis (ex Srinivasan et al. 2021)]
MKKIVLAGILAAAVSAGAAVYAAPITNPQPGDFKANINYGFDQREGGRDADSRFAGGDVTYVVNDKVDVQYVNNYTKGKNGNTINENYLKGIYRFNPYVSAYGAVSYLKTNTYSSQHAYGYQVGLQGQVPLADKWQGFAGVGFGDDANTYEIGVGYDITENWDAHVKYRRSDIGVDNYNDDVKGWQVGMGYKF